MRRSLAVLTLVALAAALLACSAPGVSSSETQHGNAISIQSNAFSPVNLETPSGTEVKWANNDAIPHQVKADDRSFDSGAIEKGRAFRFTFSKPGTYSYSCPIHGETGRVTVIQK